MTVIILLNYPLQLQQMINSHAHLDFDDMNAIAENAVAIVPSIGKQN